MKETLKRYGIAFFILFVVIGFMLLGTLGVTKFEQDMFKNVDVEMKPRGKKLE
jgi:hypothetical protein